MDVYYSEICVVQCPMCVFDIQDFKSWLLYSLIFLLLRISDGVTLFNWCISFQLISKMSFLFLSFSIIFIHLMLMLILIGIRTFPQMEAFYSFVKL